MRPLPPLLRLLPRLTSSQAPRQTPRPPASQWVLPPARYCPSIKCSCGQTSSSSKLTVGSYAAKLEFSESRLGAENVSVQIQWLGADRWQGWSQRWGKQDLRTGVFGTISIWTITITIFNNIETPEGFGVLLNFKEINLWAQILQNLFMASPFSYLLCQCLASANAEKLSNVQCFRSKADECTGEVFAILNWDLKSRGVCRRWVL